MSAAVALGGCSLIESSSPSDRDEKGEVTERNEDASVFDVQIGDCYDLPAEDATQVETMTAVSCAEPHEAEAYPEHEIDDEEFPGDAEVATLAEDSCAEAFGGFVGLGYESSELDFFFSGADGRLVAVLRRPVDLLPRLRPHQRRRDRLTAGRGPVTGATLTP